MLCGCFKGRASEMSEHANFVGGEVSSKYEISDIFSESRVFGNRCQGFVHAVCFRRRDIRLAV